MTRGLGQPAPGAAAVPAPAPDAPPATGALPGAAVELRVDGPWISTLILLGPGGEGALRRHGAEVGARAGDIVTARVPLRAVPALLGEGGIRRMEAASILAPGSPVVEGGGFPPGGGTSPRLVAANDSAMRDAGFESLRRRVGSRWEGLAGDGVIIGVYDSGLDLEHDDFRSPDGSTRVLYAWDQTTPGAPPGVVGGSAFTYGTECYAPTIDAGTCPMRDIVGHGTHVTGVAAGDGSATGRGMPAFRFPGGAPAADLIIVKGGDGQFDGARMLEGVAYVFERAAALGRPAVVNLSLATSQGPHDGTTLLERALDALSGPGRLVAAGSGNAGDHRNTFPVVPNGPNHAEGIAGVSAHALVIPAYEPVEGATNGVSLEVWYDGADSLDITIRSPRGDEVTVPFGDSALVETPGGAVAVLNAVDGPDPGNGDHAILMAIVDYGAAPPPDSGRWEIGLGPGAVHAGGAYHVWITGVSLRYLGAPPGLSGGATNRVLVGIPASADRVLAAGGHVTKHAWLGLGGHPQGYGYREALGDIAYFSSPGPRRDGVLKPDITAPAKMVVSSLSRDATLWDEFPSFVEADSAHVALLGTSVSAPQLAAALALLLQIEPELTPEEARDLIRLSAATDAFVPGDLPHPVWGAGKLDAAAAARRLRPDGLAGADQDVNLSANPVRGDALVINYTEVPRSVAVYTLIAERVRSLGPDELGPLSAIWALDTDAGGHVANGAYVLVVEFADRRVLRKILVARP